MRIIVRSLNGDSVELDLEASTTMTQFKNHIEERMHVPAGSQRLIYAGTQLEDVACSSWRSRHNRSDVSTALGLPAMPDGTELTLEHHGLQKGSVINLVQKATVFTRPRTPVQGEREIHNPTPVEPLRPYSPDNRAYSADNRAHSADNRAQRQRAAPPEVGPFMPMDAEADEAFTRLPALLDALPDLEALRLLRPLLQRRPALRAALLADDQMMPGSHVAASPYMQVGSHVAAPAYMQGSHVAAPYMQGSHVAAAPYILPGSHVAAGITGVPMMQMAAAPPQYYMGCAIHVWSNSKQRWYPGEVVNVAEVDSGAIPQGSIEVAFQLGRKWIAPMDVPRMLIPG